VVVEAELVAVVVAVVLPHIQESHNRKG